MLHVSLMLKRVANVVVEFGEDQTFEAISFGEPVDAAFAALEAASRDIPVTPE